MKGKIPKTNLLVLESNEDQWRLLTKGLINELKITALIEKESFVKVRIKLVITNIIPPEMRKIESECHIKTNLGEDIAIGLSRSKEFLNSFLAKTEWLFLGYIDGEEKVPIIITYFQQIDIAVYTQKLKNEKISDFFPKHSLN